MPILQRSNYSEHNEKMKTILPEIYLAGGFASGWQDSVIEECKPVRLTFLDPRCHGLNEPSEYTRWDLDAVRRCQIVFAYLEATNPGGYALSLELGYAKALKKKIIFVENVSVLFPERAKYLDMLREVSDFTYPDLESGVKQLISLVHE